MTLVERLQRLSKRPFVRSVAVVAGGTAAAQAITVAFSPIITRLYGPEAFGVLGVFFAIVAMVAPVATLTYGQATVLPASDGEALALVRLSLYIAAGLSAVMFVAFLIVHNQMAEALDFGAAAPYVLLVPLVVLLAATEQTLQQWLVRKKEFKAISGAAVKQSAIVNVLKSGIGLFVATAPVLLAVSTIGQVLHVGMLWRRAQSSLAPKFSASDACLDDSRVATLRAAARVYYDFPLFRMPQQLLSSVSVNVPAVILAGFLGPVSAGFYVLSNRVLSLPVALISVSVGTVFLPRIAEAGHRGERLRPLILQSTGWLALVGLLPFGTVVAVGPWLFGLVFGAEWVSAGEYARWLAIWGYLRFMNVPSVQAIPLLGLQRQLLIYEVVSMALRVGTLAFGFVVLRSDVGAIALFSVSGALLYAWLIAWVLTRSDGRLREGFVQVGTPAESSMGEEG